MIGTAIAIRRARRAVVASLLLGAFFSCAAEAQTCDPNHAANEDARTQRVAHRLDRAESIANRVLRQSPNDFRANYSLGLIFYDRVVRRPQTDPPTAIDPALLKPALDQLIKAANLVPGLGEACAKDINAYSIYNSIGAIYYNIEKREEAERYYRLAYPHRAAMNDNVRAKLYANIALMYYDRQIHACAVKYYKLAFDEGYEGDRDNYQDALEILRRSRATADCKL
jgi:tetratricopeptide (TPR) repeat protein